MFRSSDLQVMSLARFHCANSLKKYASGFFFKLFFIFILCPSVGKIILARDSMLHTMLPDSLVGQDSRFSPCRPGFDSRSGNFSFAREFFSFFFFFNQLIFYIYIFMDFLGMAIRTFRKKYVYTIFEQLRFYKKTKKKIIKRIC